MSRQIDEDMIHFEKRAANKKAIFLVLFLFVIIIGVGGFFIYKYRDKFDWNLTLPWEKEEEYEILGNNNGPNTIPKNNNSNNKLIVPTIGLETYQKDNTLIKLYDLAADDKGYTLKIDFTSFRGAATINIEKILVDGFDTSSTLTLTDTEDIGTREATTATIRILKTELDALDIICFKRLTLYYRIDSLESEKKLNRTDVTLYSGVEFNNSIEGLIQMSDNGGTLARYYRTLTDKDYIYIYFDFLNNNHNVSKNIKIKKLLINDELYEYKLNELIYAGSEKIFYLSIPRNEVKDLKSFNISFFIMDISPDSNDNNSITTVYTTPEYIKTF